MRSDHRPACPAQPSFPRTPTRRPRPPTPRRTVNPDPPPPAYRLPAALELYKAHGLGNDYLVADEGGAWSLTPETVRRVCHRHRGPGADGIVWVGSGEAPFRLRMFNPDGSEFERSGNGLRVAASHLYRAGRVGNEPFAVRIGGDTVRMQVHAADRAAGRYDISVSMGRARVGPRHVGLDASAAEPGGAGEPGEPWIRLSPAAGLEVRLIPVSVGNPHAVVWGDPEPFPSLDPAHGGRDLLARIGPGLSTHPAFAHGVNVQLARTVAPQRIEALVWERGVGHTASSGTSACAVAVAAVSTGAASPGPIQVVMEGGVMEVGVEADLAVTLRAPVEEAWTGRPAPGAVRSGPGSGGPGP